MKSGFSLMAAPSASSAALVFLWARKILPLRLWMIALEAAVSLTRANCSSHFCRAMSNSPLAACTRTIWVNTSISWGFSSNAR